MRKHYRTLMTYRGYRVIASIIFCLTFKDSLMSLETKCLDDILRVEENTKNVRMSEAQFVNIVLPLIAQTDGDNVALDDWLKLTGSWQKGIDVYDDSDADRKLFEVPPLVSTRDIKISKPGKRSVNDIIEDATRKMAIIPRAGQDSLVRALTNKIESAGDRNRNIEKWNYIFKRYGLNDHIVGDVESVSTTIQESNITVDGYDEL